jgi:hypothetical protein
VPRYERAERDDDDHGDGEDGQADDVEPRVRPRIPSTIATTITRAMSPASLSTRKPLKTSRMATPYCRPQPGEEGGSSSTPPQPERVPAISWRRLAIRAHEAAW